MSKSNPVEKSVTLKAGDAGVIQTVTQIARLGVRDSKDPQIIEIAESKRGATDALTIEKIYNWVWKTFDYEPDPADEEYVTAPIHLVNFNYEYCDCDDLTALLVALLTALDYEVVIKVISWDRSRCEGSFCPFTHVYLYVWLNDENAWLPLDAVQKNNGFGIEKPPQPIIRQKYFSVN